MHLDQESAHQHKPHTVTDAMTRILQTAVHGAAGENRTLDLTLTKGALYH